MSLSSQDHVRMQQALALAEKGRFTTHPNPNVGCIIVSPTGDVVGEGWHVRAGEPHAEVFALRAAGEKAKGATAYVTLEPCSHFGRTGPCADALIEAGVSRVVVAMRDPFKEVAGRGIQKLLDAGVQVDVGLLERESRALNKGFLKRCETGLPWVQLKLAASLDGKTALANGDSKWITSAAARADVHEGRATAGAIISGADTVLADNPQLNVRPLTNSLQAISKLRQPLRVIIDSQGRLTPDLNVFQDGNPVIIVRTHSQMGNFPAHVEELQLPAITGKVDLKALLTELATRNIHTVWVETGSTLAGAFIESQLVDELIVYVAPKLLGADAQPLVALNPLMRLQDAPEFELAGVERIEHDLKLTYFTNSHALHEELSE